jgi:SAM-dependent methyltransferase
MTACTHPVDLHDVLFPARDYITGDAFEVRRCRDCGLAMTWPRPADMGRHYPDAYYGEASEKRFVGPIEKLQASLYGSRAGWVERAAGGKPGSVLDVGCGRGFLLDAFRRRGWTVQGTELSEAS